MENVHFNKEDMEALVCTLNSLHLRGISINKTLNASVHYLKQFYELTNDKEYLILAIMYMKAYSEMGFAGISKENEALFDEVLSLAQIEKETLFRFRLYTSQKIKLNKSQVRSMIGKWSVTRERPMSKDQLVADIIEKVNSRADGHYYYIHKHRGSGIDMDRYELVINGEECYFHDEKRGRYFTFEEA